MGEIFRMSGMLQSIPVNLDDGLLQSEAYEDQQSSSPALSSIRTEGSETAVTATEPPAVALLSDAPVESCRITFEIELPCLGIRGQNAEVPPPNPKSRSPSNYRNGLATTLPPPPPPTASNAKWS